MRRKLAGFAVAMLLVAAGQTAQPVVATAKSCSAGFKHAILPTGHKCLRRGQFCAKRYDSTYHRYGYHCHTGRLR